MENIKRFVVPAIFCFILCITAVSSQEQKAIDLPAPQKTGGKPLMEALAQRQTIRSFSSKELSPQVMSNLLWAAFGINRPDGRRTAPSAANRKEIDIYVATANGTFLYDAQENQLKPVVPEDIRPAVPVNKAFSAAPVILIYVSDYNRMGGADAIKDFYSATDTGFISQNVYLFCASEGMATVVIGQVNKTAAAANLGLAAHQKIILAQPVGYKAP